MLSSHPGDPGDEDPGDYDGRGSDDDVHKFYVTLVMTRVDFTPSRELIKTRAVQSLYTYTHSVKRKTQMRDVMICASS